MKLLDSVDQERALFFARQTSLQRFDPELAKVILTGVGDESVRSRLQLAAALIEAEKKFLSGQSQSVFNGTYTGDYGQKMRGMITAEYGMLEERRRLARIQNVTTALAVAMLAGSVYGTSVSGTVIASALQNITGVLVLGSIWAISSSLKTRAKSGTITETFMALMAPEIDQQTSVQLEWMESKEKITARGFAEFRDKQPRSTSRGQILNAGSATAAASAIPPSTRPDADMAHAKMARHRAGAMAWRAMWRVIPSSTWVWRNPAWLPAPAE
jgi:hypothetical protein